MVLREKVIFQLPSWVLDLFKAFGRRHSNALKRMAVCGIDTSTAVSFVTQQFSAHSHCPYRTYDDVLAPCYCNGNKELCLSTPTLRVYDNHADNAESLVNATLFLISWQRR